MTADSMQESREVACPTCRGPSLYAPENRWRPFCSERCRGLDFSAWASESFRIEEAGDPQADLRSDDLIDARATEHRATRDRNA